MPRSNASRAAQHIRAASRPKHVQLEDLRDELRARFQREEELRTPVEHAVVVRVPLPPADVVHAAVRNQVEQEFADRRGEPDTDRSIAETTERRFQLVMTGLQRRSPSVVAAVMSNLIESELKSSQQMDARFVRANDEASNFKPETTDYLWAGVVYLWARDLLGLNERHSLDFLAQILGMVKPEDSHGDRQNSGVRKCRQRSYGAIKGLWERATGSPLPERARLTFSHCVRLAETDRILPAHDRRDVTRLRRMIESLDSAFLQLARARK